jgi:hypothetical protein
VQEPLPPSLLQRSLRKPSFYLPAKKPKKATDLDEHTNYTHKTPDVYFAKLDSSQCYETRKSERTTNSKEKESSKKT